MEFRYEEYYEKDMIYKANTEEFVAADHKSEEIVLAWMRHVGVQNVEIVASVPSQAGICDSGMGFGLVDADKNEFTTCRMISGDSIYDPLNEEDNLRENHWFHPHKIRFTPKSFDGVQTEMYFMDFCSSLRSGQIKLYDARFTSDRKTN